MDDHLSRPGVTAQAQAIAGRDGQPHASHCILHQVGFTSRTSRQAVGELLPRLSILTRRTGRYISVALSLESPPPAVNRHPALRCSDFPHTLRHAIVWSPRTGLMITREEAKVNGRKKGSRGDAPCAGGGARSPSWVWAKPRRIITPFPRQRRGKQFALYANVHHKYHRAACLRHRQPLSPQPPHPRREIILRHPVRRH